MFCLSSSDGNGNPVCISTASGPIHLINVATRSVEGCLSNPVTIPYAFQICIHFFQLAARFPLVSNFCGSDTLAMNLVNGGVFREQQQLLLHLACSRVKIMAARRHTIFTQLGLRKLEILPQRLSTTRRHPTSDTMLCYAM